MVALKPKKSSKNNTIRDGFWNPPGWAVNQFNGNKPKKKKKVAKRKKTLRKKSQPYIESDDFLNSFEWRRLRYEVLKFYGGKCMCCGRSAKDGVVMHVDHIKSRKRFPALALVASNLQVLCAACNHGKGNWDQTDWRPNELRLSKLMGESI